MKYIVSHSAHHQHFIDIEMITEAAGGKLQVQLPSWRPGRYELANFAKNVRKWSAFNAKGKALEFRKLTKDLWEVDAEGEVHIKYSYYAIELDAGNSYLGDTQLFMNPCNCCMYVPGKMNEAVQMEIILPENYRVACSMKKDNPVKEGKMFRHTLHASGFHELADSPLIASPALKHNMFVMDGIEFNIWIEGECKPDWSKIINDFFIFINEEVCMMKGCPVKEYHFLYHLLPCKSHHGVEHLGCTDISIGPAYNFMKDEMYNDFLSVSCHELFHCWNIKSIRPAEMYPYDYSKENYSRLGYIYEGITNYYGNYLLYRSGVFNESEYLKEVQSEFQKHFDNYGRFNLSVALSSFDTWLDGYTPGVPGRKVSIYTEGGLLAFITDMFIRKNTVNKKSLDDVMQILYHEYAQKGKSYSETDYCNLVEKAAGCSYAEIFDNYINKPSDLHKPLVEALGYIGLVFHTVPGKKYYERFWGMKTSEEHGTGHGALKVTAIAPDSPAEKAGIYIGDEITMINHHPVKNNFNDWCEFYSNEEVTLTLISENKQRAVKVVPAAGKEFYPSYHIYKVKEVTLEQKAAYRKWCNRDF